ncbi:MAG: AAA family ATPase [Firmicutes bacterium]|nr:AAA family ATPase [Bacillota bacterium]
MIIKNIYIDNFGCLSKVSKTFNEHLNIISSDNETGKSTTAEFIKAMLYGITAGSRSIRANERTRFMPWGQNSMGGRMTLSKDEKEYTIIRTFGKVKSQDTVTVINATTGAVEDELSIYSPGEVLLGIGQEGFEKSLYLKQLSAKLLADKNDEILQKLVNLAQSGDDETSFQRAITILDGSAKKLAGTRPLGKIPAIQNEINNMQAVRTECESKKNILKTLTDKLNDLSEQKKAVSAFVPDKSKISKLKMQYESSIIAQTKEKQKQQELMQMKSAKAKTFILQTALAAAFSVAMLFIKPIAAIPFVIWGLLSVIFFLKSKGNKINVEIKDLAAEILKEIEIEEQKIAAIEKENTNRLIEIVRQISETESKINNMQITPIAEIENNLARLRETHDKLNSFLDDITLAKKCLQEAFESLQKSFGKELNDATSSVLNEISNGKYSKVLVDDNYNMLAMDTEANELIDAQYLSSGAYDQIYFALRMGIAQMLFKGAPIILDEAFALYDEPRLNAALDYLRKQKSRQILLFSCHKREQQRLAFLG